MILTRLGAVVLALAGVTALIILIAGTIAATVALGR